jgi:hypothetical protein
MGHSRPSSLLVHDASSSEHAAMDEVQLRGLFFPNPDVQAFDAKPHISAAQRVHSLEDVDFTCSKISL